MPIESGNFITNLDDANPLPSDLVSTADDHIRLIKHVLKSTFIGHGAGWNKAVTVNPVEINMLAGIRTDITIQTQINNLANATALKAPPGTVLIFFQAAPPAGWTLQTAHNDAMLRIVNGTGGGSGGITSPITFDWNHQHATVGHALTVAEMAPHLHHLFGNDTIGSSPPLDGDDVVSSDAGYGGGVTSYFMGRSSQASPSVGVTDGGAGLSGVAHNHGNVSFNGSVWQPRYINVIKAIKA